jgi:MFS family permease
VAFPLFAGADFGWTERELARYFTLIGIVAASVQGYFFGKLSKIFGDRVLIIVGMLCLAIPLGITPYVWSGVMLYGVGVAIALGNSVAAPALTGMISALSGAKEQGTMLGAAHAVSALGRLSGPFVFGVAYDLISPAAAFLAAATVMLGAWVVVLRVRGETA